MMKTTLALLALAVCAHSYPTKPGEWPPTDAAAPPCCVGACKTAGEEKYWSIAHGIFGGQHCGECCMDPSKYKLYHFFEKNLTKSATSEPCKGFGFTKYDSTVTHGFGPIKMTLDLYDKPSEQPNSMTARSVPLATFDKTNKALTHDWRETNDPVMGGASTGTFTVKGGVAIMDGSVNLIPRLQAPGFIKFETSDNKAFPDASGCKALSFVARSATNFTGYRVSIGSKHAPGGKFFAYGFKAPFDAPMGEFAQVTIPFNQFSDFWDDATGKIIKTCAEDKRLCPDEKTLKNMSPITFWAEGVQGKVHLEVKSIDATHC